MRWNAAIGAIARCKRVSTGCGRKRRSAHAWRWICGVKPKPKAVNKPSPHFIVHGLDKPGGFTTVSKRHPTHGVNKEDSSGRRRQGGREPLKNHKGDADEQRRHEGTDTPPSKIAHGKFAQIPE